MKIFWLSAAALFALPGLAGCGGNSSPKNTSGPIFPAPRSVSATLSNGLTGTLTEDRSTVPVGGTVTYTATLTNSTTQPITYQPVLSGTNSFSVPASLVVKNSSGQAVFPSGAVATFVGIGASVTLVPGQSVSGTAAVSTDYNSGYTFTPGYGSGGTYSATATFGVVPVTPPASASGTSTIGPLLVTAQ